MINGVIFDNRYVRAKDMAVALQSALPDGVCKGCAITYNRAAVNIGLGYMISAGRLIQIMSAETVNTTQTSGYARIKLVIDLSRTSSSDSFNQAYFTVDYASTLTGFPTLIQGNINAGSDLVYESEVCVLSLGSSGVTGIVRQSVVSSADTVIVDGQSYKLRTGTSGAAGYITFDIGS